MATPKTVATYDLNGSLREFDFAFDYLARSFVQVTLIGATRQVLTEGTGYSFVSATRIQTAEAYGPPQWTQIEIRRVTSATERLVDFQDASILRADDLNLSDLQVLHIAEEAREAATETIGTNSEGMLDARGRRIVNLANPVDPGDAVSRLFYDTDKNGALVARNEAVAARNGALTSQQAAADSQTAARASEVAAKASQDAAKVSQDSAAASQVASKASENAAKASENAAKASENAARASQTAAATSQVAAKVSEDAAKVSQTAAAGSESRARASEVTAKSSETNAAESQASATASMNAAESYKTAAAASQAAAKVSEDAASASKASAQDSSILSMKWAVNPENVEISTGQYSSMHWALKAQAWAQAAESGVLPAGGVKWPMLDTDLQTNRFLPLSGGTLNGGLSVTGGLTAAGVSSASMTVGGKAVATAESVTGVTTRVSTLESTTASLGTRATNLESTTASLGTRATNLESRAGSLESSTSRLNTRVGSLEAVKPVLKVNSTAPDASGNVTISVPAGGVPLNCYGQIGEIAMLATNGGRTAVAPGATIAGSQLIRWGHDSSGTASGWVGVPGTWRMLGYAGTGGYSLYQRIS